MSGFVGNSKVVWGLGVKNLPPTRFASSCSRSSSSQSGVPIIMFHHSDSNTVWKDSEQKVIGKLSQIRPAAATDIEMVSLWKFRCVINRTKKFLPEIIG